MRENPLFWLRLSAPAAVAVVSTKLVWNRMWKELEKTAVLGLTRRQLRAAPQKRSVKKEAN